MTSSILGYDARLADFARLTKIWANDRRNKYLLVPTVAAPLSVDRIVWPSVFDIFERDPKLAEISAAQPLRLWDGPAEIPKILSQSGVAQTEYVLIAVTIHRHPDDILNDTLRIRLYEPSPLTPEVGRWETAGFDIADGYCESAVSNLHLPEIDQRAWRAKWSMGLNEFGLFSRFDNAYDFKVELDKKVASHAPLFVYELLVDKDNSWFLEQFKR